ncbi:hypothetical protein OG301_19635 [Streptomyces platensis]|uniref:hypothetical protein n=1 Tax=Streptomyces platensis TaxID=58346 RepID=UPI002E7FE22D|nr:hypothetical protein [Streptomyces platensis]WTI53413.1 hypothetical protein OG301_19635 [Streptomyces platensis]WUB80964.1 hypothetical protein OG424_18350 [Streptomyces platensis]
MAERRKAAVPCSAIRSVTRRPVISAAGSGMAVGAAQRSEEGFTSAGAARVMVAACRAAGLDERGEELIRFGENGPIDFEAFCFDHPEWDLMVTAVEHHSLGWQTDEQYADFVTAYRRDPTTGTGTRRCAASRSSA